VPRWPNMLPLYDFKHPRIPHKRGGANLMTRSIDPRPTDTGYTNTTQGKWWSLSGSNRRPEACKATALPAELRPLGESSGWLVVRGPSLRTQTNPPQTKNHSPIMVGLGRLERPTSPLSGVRSNHLSYRPEPHPKPPIPERPFDRCIRRRKRNEDGSVPHRET
jgi:hypothetical protein